MKAKDVIMSERKRRYCILKMGVNPYPTPFKITIQEIPNRRKAER